MSMSPRLLRPRQSGFTPRSISGLALWLDASDASSLYQDAAATIPATASNDPVGAWLDKSGNGRHAVQATAGNRPVVGTLNGRKALTFDGSNDNLFVEDYSVDNSLPGMTRFIAFDSDSTASMIFATTSTSAKTANAGGGIWWQRFGSNWYGYSADAVRYHGGTADESPHIATNFFDGTLAASFGTRLQNYIDGVLLPVVGSQGTLGTTTGASGAKLSIGSNLGINNFVNGKILEVLSYTRALTTTERQRVERYLAARWGIAIAPTVANADAQDWINRVYANGGTVSASTAAAVNAFCNAIDSAGIRDRFFRMGIFAGSNLNAALVPLYRGPSLGGTQYGNAIDTNVGPFVSGDYAETGASGGLTGSLTGKRLDTGLAGSSLTPGDRHLAHYQSIASTKDYSPSIISGPAFGSTSSQHAIGPWTSVAQHYYRTHATIGGNPNVSTNANGFYIGIDTSSTASRLRLNGSTISTTSGQTAANSGTTNYFVFGNGENSNARINGYSIGLSMTDSQAAAYNTAMQAFQTDLQRNV